MSNKQLLWIFLAVAMVGVLSCKKIELPDEQIDDDPIFFLNAEGANGNPFQLAAGEDDYYMSTAFERGDFDVWIFSGKLEELDCEDPFCGPSFELRIRDREVNLGNQVLIEQSLASDLNYGYVGTENTTILFDTTYSYFINFTSSVGGQPQSFLWFEEDTIQFSNLENPVLQRFDDDPFEVSLEVSGQQPDCSGSIKRFVDFSGQPTCNLSIERDSSKLTVTAFSGQPPYAYAWSTGETSPLIQVNTPGNYCVTVTDAANCVVSGCVEVNQNISQDPCSAGFTYQSFIDEEVEEIPIVDSLELSDVILIYTDEGGQVYRSDLEEQFQGAFFEVLSNKAFGLNENGEPVQVLKIRFSANLFREDGQEPLLLKSEESAIGIAYPGG
jgi:hypothetical protein